MKIGGLFLLGVLGIVFISCVKQNENTSSSVPFTHVDSLTEAYLMLQDSVLMSWNVMLKDENEKLQNIHELLTQLKTSEFYNKEQITSLQQRLEQLERIRFSQKSMINTHVVEEYDFASNSLVSEIISLVESDPTFVQNLKLQQLADMIKLADQRVSNYREEYDEIVTVFNQFLQKNGHDLKEIDSNWGGEPKPTFSDPENK